jgi:ABC-type nickel/cobalt efflux system permease component RcnA
MFSAMKRIRATAGGQRDSPMFASPGGVTRASYAGRVEVNRSERWLELVSTVLLALATVATAWAAYQSRQWTGEQAQGYSHATATRIAENRSAALANRQVQIDVATFIQWVDAHARHDDVLADFYRARFRDEFKPAFAAWLATKPFTSPQAPPTPFAMPRYRLRSAVEADRLEQTAAANSQHAKAANENADNYMLAVVLFASSLFFAGISVKLDTVRTRAALLGLGCVVFLGTLVWALTLPVHVAT